MPEPLTPPHVPYRGRFAPSPTGPLHFGSLVAAVGSFLDARHHGGHWYVRIEDLDPPREIPGAAADILRTLDGLGLHWDDEVIYQSQRASTYAAVLERLAQAGLTFPCGCSRKEIEVHTGTAAATSVYPGTCRDGLAPGRQPRAIRLRVDECTLSFVDRIQGRFRQHLTSEVGDFVVRRADGLTAYQLAVTVDDAEQHITHIVRGCDLLDSTPRQMLLQHWLDHATPSYAHLPVAADAGGRKLSKQTGARAVEIHQPGALLFRVLAFLDQRPPLELAQAPASELLNWAIEHWNLAHVPRRRSRPYEDQPIPVLSKAGRRKIE